MKYILYLCLLIVLVACKSTTKIETKQTTTRDTLRSVIVRVDSIVNKDSIIVQEKTSNDTIYKYMTRFKTKERWRTRIDTFKQVKIDTIYIQRKEKIKPTLNIGTNIALWGTILVVLLLIGCLRFRNI